MDEQFERLPMPRVRIGQIWSHHHDCTHYLIFGKTDKAYLPWKGRVVKENPVLIQQYHDGTYCIGHETELALGLGTGVVGTPAWYLVTDAHPCPSCDKPNYIPDDDYICEVCRG